MTSTTISNFAALTAQHQQAVELTLQGQALHNDLEAQLIEQIAVALTSRDDQAIRDINAFMVDVMTAVTTSLPNRSVSFS